MKARRLRSVLGALGAAAIITGCAAPAAVGNGDTNQRITALLPSEAILLGEQHDAPDHHRIEREAVQALAAQGVLAALVLEMAEAGHSTAGLAPDASAAQVRAALHWDDRAWPWHTYGPPVMAAVRAGVPVAGANLPRAQMKEAAGNVRFDKLLAGPAFKAQQQLIRNGHCDLLPESQITPLTRIQIARDLSMANTVNRLRTPAKTVLLLAGNGHVDRSLGVPQHLPPPLSVTSVGLVADPVQETHDTLARFDRVWPALAAPAKDYCAEFKLRRTAATPGRD